ncbi:methylmalonyl-CoA mutase [Bacillus pakistanensis]|uniref:Methylmalonyl-CoA mutase n=1 Tax=Rossellomorea pakistanensis TaxID=992288 RepID=A0ABS2N9L8_9BACI|nr:methylmalonyl-CoA mutase family protein [Bacillus pakistanensis]MBM7584551.1 methylmalonyl-CoA mutase [Bacillus pakistanensis]
MKLSEMKNQSFDNKTLEEWQVAAEKALKGKSLDALQTTTYEGIILKPLYTGKDLPKGDRIQSYIPGIETKIEAENKWFLAQSINGVTWDDLMAKVKESQSKGQNCISFTIGSLTINDEFDRFFNNVLDTDIPIFKLGERSFSSMAKRITELADNETVFKKLEGVLGQDPLSEKAFCNENLSLEEWLNEVEMVTSSCPQLKTMVVNTAPYHNRGANAVQELSFAISEGVFYIEFLKEKGWDIETITRKMNFHFSVGSHFFMEVAKLRAFKKLWQDVLKEYGLTEEQIVGSISISAETSRFNKSKLDSHVNILRSGGEAFSAILAGVDYLQVQPFNGVVGETNSLSERVARNTHLIIGEEAHLNKVVDPGGGSYFLEWLTEEVGKRAWKEFQRMDREGGFITLLRKGAIQQSVESIREERIHDLSTRKQSMIGTNIYANPEDTLTENQTVEDVERLSLPFENLRKKAGDLSESGVKPTAGIIGLSKLKHHKSRADFVNGFLAVGGISVSMSNDCSTKEEILEFIEETRYPYYVICGRDQDYEHYLPLVLETVNRVDEKIVIDIAGKIETEQMNEWKQAGLNGSIFLKQNMLQKLEELLHIWEGAEEHGKA